MNFIEQKSLYDSRYSSGYRETLSGFEYARCNAIAHTINSVLNLGNAEHVLDYGAGSGLHVELWKSLFPSARLAFCDISTVALGRLVEKHPEYKNDCYLIKDNIAPITNNNYDVITSVEVMEHVEDLDSYICDIKRLLKPNGYFFWTTPCANSFSIEHIYGLLTNQIETTKEGFVRWKWEDPTHLRRLKSAEILNILNRHGFKKIGFRFRAHFFSFVCTKFCRGKLQRLGERLMLLDYKLFKRLPNAASMIGFAQKDCE